VNIFYSCVNGFDVLCLVETKTDDLDEIIIPGFITKYKNRKAFANRKSGGINILNSGKLSCVLIPQQFKVNTLNVLFKFNKQSLSISQKLSELNLFLQALTGEHFL
jgi:hypothetical protein